MTAKRIMVVDDDANMRSVLEFRLRKEGYSVSLASDGLDALDKVKGERPDLIILDLLMPEMDGHEVLDQLKHDPATHDIPVIVLTCKGDNATRLRSFKLGAAHFVPKPFSPRKLVHDVRAALGDTLGENRR